MTRKLATIRMIGDVSPIDGADAIECVTIDGWKVVAKKGEFSPGDYCIYFEIDSVLPIREEFEFLRKGCYVQKEWLESETNPTGEGFRLKTIKLRGQISQGLVVKITDLPEFKGLAAGPSEDYDLPEGWSVDHVLNIVKWDPPVPATLAGKVRGNFPPWIPKTDQERIQNLSDKDLAPYLNDDFEVTMKLDGSSMTVFYDEGRIGVCSRNLELDWENDPSTTFAKMVMGAELDKIFARFAEDNGPDDPPIKRLALQGELMGPGIQGNREKFKEHRFFVFDIFLESEGYVVDEQRRAIVDLIACSQIIFGASVIFEHVPVIGHNIPIIFNSKDEILEYAKGPSINHPIREGIVYKSVQHPEFSFKAISNDFLLKGGE